jgi:hypothetical protein
LQSLWKLAIDAALSAATSLSVIDDGPTLRGEWDSGSERQRQMAMAMAMATPTVGGGGGGVGGAYMAQSAGRSSGRWGRVRGGSGVAACSGIWNCDWDCDWDGDWNWDWNYNWNGQTGG